MTTNKYWIYLENLIRRSGIVLSDYNPNDYSDEDEEEDFDDEEYVD